MNVSRDSSSPTSERSKDLLVQAAKRLFALKGYDATTVREIAQQAGVNLSLVSYYFEGKEGLYRHVIEGFGRDRMQALERILQPAQNASELKLRLKMLFEEIISVSFREKDLMTIIFREIDHGLPVAEKVFDETFHQMFDRMVDFFSGAQRLGFLNPKLDPTLLAQIAHGFVLHLVRTNDVCKRFQNHTIQDEAFRNEAVETFLKVFLEGSLKPTSSPPGGYL